MKYDMLTSVIVHSLYTIVEVVYLIHSKLNKITYYIFCKSNTISNFVQLSILTSQIIINNNKMVSISRKKNKGKDRKAKKVEAERARVREMWLGWAQGEDKVTGKKIKCDHRRVTIPNDLDHPVSRFMNDLITYRTADNVAYSTVRMLCDTLQTYPQVWNDNRYREMVVSILTSMGTNMLLMETGDTERGVLWALDFAKSIAILENRDVTGCFEATVSTQKVAIKRRDLGSPTSSSRRDTLKFFSKRVPCSCLKERHQKERETMPKMGVCFRCQKEEERVALSVCSRCMIAQYCSRECQVTDWTKHEWICGRYVAQNKNQVDESVETETG